MENGQKSASYNFQIAIDRGLCSTELYYTPFHDTYCEKCEKTLEVWGYPKYYGNENVLTLHKRFSIHPDRRKEILFHLVSWLYIALYAYTAIEKLIAHAQFETTLRQSVLIGGMSVFISWAVPITELIICVLLVLPWTQRLGLWAATGLMVLFTLYIGYMLLFAETLTCECGGFISDLSRQQHLVFILLGASALYQQHRIKKFS